MAVLRELLDLAIRWTHVIAAIMWIGNSLLFNWLDRNLRPAARPHEGSRGEAWLLHSGGFYEVEKTLAPGETLPRPLHWFKWQAYITWLSGVALLLLVYWMNGAALLLNPGLALPAGFARFLSAALLLGGLALYEMLWHAPTTRSSLPRIALSVALLLAMVYPLTRAFSGRALFLHTGALLGTIMAANVFFHIMPAQRRMVGAIEGGRPTDPRLSERAKVRSIHNNYLTFPVVALMVSSHFPGLHGHDRGVAVLALLLIAGATIRHILNVRFDWRPWAPALAATILLSFGALYLVAARPFGAPPAPRGASLEPVMFEQAEAIIRKRCTVCHSASPADRSFGIAPGSVMFDTPEQMRALAPRIRVRAIETTSMPPNNWTHMTNAERELLARWVYEQVP